MPHTKPIPSTKSALGRGDCFLTTWRPEEEEISTDSEDAINKWFETIKIQTGPIANTPKWVAKAKQLFCTWKSCFAEKVCDAKATELVKHSVDLVPDARPVMGEVPNSTAAEYVFGNTVFSQLEDQVKYKGGKNKISSKEKGSAELRVVHNFIPVNRYTIKSQYPRSYLDLWIPWNSWGLKGLRPSAKHRNNIQQMPVPTFQEELDAFLWLTPFLRIFIPGQTGLVMELKEAYLEQVLAPLKKVKSHDGEIKDGDHDLTKPANKKEQAPKNFC